MQGRGLGGRGFGMPCLLIFTSGFLFPCMDGCKLDRCFITLVFDSVTCYHVKLTSYGRTNNCLAVEVYNVHFHLEICGIKHLKLMHC